MNSLSWIIYAAEVANNFTIVLVVFVVFGVIAAILLTIFGMFMRGDAEWRSWSREDKDTHKAHWEAKRQQCASAAQRLWPAIGIVLLLVVITPSKGTLYAIAASEVGEQIVKSEEVRGIANDATKALHRWIKRQIEPEKKQ